jgi:hypothetical protein
MLTRNRHVRSVMAGRQGLRRNLSVFTRGWAMATHPALCAGHRPLVLVWWAVTVDHPQRVARAGWLAKGAQRQWDLLLPPPIGRTGGWTGDMARPSIVNV